MICGPPELLEAAALIHGAAYRDSVLAHAQKRGDQLCIEQAKLKRIRKAHGIAAAKPEPATLPQRLRSLAAALLRWCRNGFALTPARLYRRRSAICARCPHWNPANRATSPIATCALCGCATALKLRLPTERCPATPPRW